ncbi:MAG: DUF6398 domain-containing protein [Intestinibacter sp.]
MENKYSIPENMKEKTELIIKEIEKFCNKKLNDNFKDKAIRLTCKLSTKSPSPLEKDSVNICAAAIIDTIMKINSLYDAMNPIYIMKKNIYEEIGVSQNIVIKKSGEIIKLLSGDGFSRELLVKENKVFNLNDFLEDMYNDFNGVKYKNTISYDDKYQLEDYKDEKNILKVIENEDINLLSEKELEKFAVLCMGIATLLIREVKENIEEDDDYYYKKSKKIEMVLNKAYAIAVKVFEINREINLYLSVLDMMAEVCIFIGDLDTALEKYKEIQELEDKVSYYDLTLKLKIFSVRYLTKNEVKMYLDLQKKEKSAVWDYNRALYYFHLENYALALKYLKKGFRKNKYIKDMLLNNYKLDLNRCSTAIENEAVNYYKTSSWIWILTDGALEWLFNSV